MSLAIAAVLFVAITVLITGDFYVEVLLQGSIDGGILAAWLLAAFGLGCLMLRRLGDTPAGLRVVTEIALGLGVLGLIEAGLGFAGLLSGVTAWAAIGSGIAAALYALRDRSFSDVKTWLADKSPAANVAWLWAVLIAVAFVAASMAPGILWKPLDPHPYDVLSYHLQIPREWYDAGRIVPLRHNSFSFFPMGMETHFLTAMHLRGGPWAGMYLCQFVSLAHGVLAAVAVTAVCRSMGVGKVVSTLAGIATLAVPWVLMLSSVCYVESGVMLYTLLAAAWAVRGMQRSRVAREEDLDAAAGAADRSSHKAYSSNEAHPANESAAHAAASGTSVIVIMTLAGAFAGFACGMKYTAVAMTALPLLGVWPVVAWPVIDRKRLAMAWLAAAIACALVFSPWLIRNAMTTGNPVFPLATGVFGSGHFTADQVDRYRIAHSPPAAERSVPARLTAAWRGVVVDPQFAYVLVPASVIAVALAIVRRSRAGIFVSLALLAMAGVWLFATHLLPRFITPAIPLVAVLVTVSVASWPRVGPWVGGAVWVVQIVAGLVFTTNALHEWLPAGQGLLRLSDMNELQTDNAKAACQSGRKIVLIGDAQAFVWPVPSERLIYRGVFDVVVPTGGSLADGWTGKSIEDWRRDGCYVVVSVPELRRLSRTYANLPLLEEPWSSWEFKSTPQLVLPPLQ